MIERIRYILERRADGFRPSEIAKEVDKPIRYVESVIDGYRKKGGWVFPELPRASHMLDLYLDYIIMCSEAGLICTEIACNLGIDYHVVHNFCEYRGINLVSGHSIRESGYTIDRPMTDVEVQIGELRKDGIPLKEVASRLGVSFHKVAYTCSKYKFKQVVPKGKHRCVTCKRDLHISEFGNNKNKPNGKSSQCKECYKAKNEAWRNTETGKAFCIKARKQYRDKPGNREIEREYSRKRRDTPEARERERIRNARRNLDLSHRLRQSVGCRISQFLAGTTKRDFVGMLGYTPNELMCHLESQFIDGMTKENYGEWHVDHIIPVSWWEYSSTDDSEFKQCWSLANLQPLWAFDNHSKSNRYAG